MGEILRVEGLSKSFTVHSLGKTIHACHDITIAVSPGEFVGITGRSGSGKSTVLKLVHRTYLPQQGAVWYDSARYGLIDLTRASDREVIYLRRHEIGYVSQFLEVMPRSTARETVEHGVLDMGLDEETARERANRALSHFEIAPELWDSYAATFSGGEKLRLNIARAMAKRPRLLLLDEPTASLDALARARVREVILRLKQDGTTMLGIFHDLEFMKGLCDRQYDMELGRFIG